MKKADKKSDKSKDDKKYQKCKDSCNGDDWELPWLDMSEEDSESFMTEEKKESKPIDDKADSFVDVSSKMKYPKRNRTPPLTN